MTSPHHHSPSVPHVHEHPHQHPHPVADQATWLLHSAAWRGLWALAVCSCVVAALLWAMAGQG